MLNINYKLFRNYLKLIKKNLISKIQKIQKKEKIFEN